MLCRECVERNRKIASMEAEIALMKRYVAECESLTDADYPAPANASREG